MGCSTFGPRQQESLAAARRRRTVAIAPGPIVPLDRAPWRLNSQPLTTNSYHHRRQTNWRTMLWHWTPRRNRSLNREPPPLESPAPPIEAQIAAPKPQAPPIHTLVLVGPQTSTIGTSIKNTCARAACHTIFLVLGQAESKGKCLTPGWRGVADR